MIPSSVDPRLRAPGSYLMPPSLQRGFLAQVLPEFAHLAAGRYEPRQYVVPGPLNQDLTVGAVHEARLSLPPESWIVGFSGSVYDADDPVVGMNFNFIEVQLLDLRDGARFFAQPSRFANLCGADEFAQPVMFLPRPRLVIEPAVLGVQIKNLDTGPRRVQFVIWVVEPIDVTPISPANLQELIEEEGEFDE